MNHDDLGEFENLNRFNVRCGPCDDDVQTTAPYVGMLPDESEGEEPSPLHFRSLDDDGLISSF